MPRDSNGFIDERKVYNMLGKCGLPLDSLYDNELSEVVFYYEGVIESERQYFEYMNYSLFSSIRQALGKGEFTNPFKKEEIEEKKLPTNAEHADTLEAMQEIFGL